MAYSWLQEHLEGFVKPYLGYIPVIKPDEELYFSPEEMVLLKAVLRSAKAEAKLRGLHLLLTGRDTWVLHVLACRENYDHAYRPDICRNTRDHIKENYTEFLCLDTGYAGSIPKALRCKAWTMLSDSAAGTLDIYHYPGYKKPAQDTYNTHREISPMPNHLHQSLRCNQFVRNLSGRLEMSPKYWQAAVWKDPAEVSLYCNSALEDLRKQNWSAATGIGQQLVAPRAFEGAAKLTIQVYKDKSPAFMKDLSKLKSGRGIPKWLTTFVQ